MTIRLPTTSVQADSIAEFLRRNNCSARSYHAGKRLEEREAVQGAFLSGQCRVVVATVAFGMGIDKQQLGGVVHACMPRSLEEYVQQVRGLPCRSCQSVNRPCSLRFHSVRGFQSDNFSSKKHT